MRVNTPLSLPPLSSPRRRGSIQMDSRLRGNDRGSGNDRGILLLVIIIFAFLSGCSTVVKDGPPSANIDVSRIPDAIPKLEPLSKYGNKRMYAVFGKTYHVLPSSQNYKERGVASWYGTKFHQRKTSSGEPYNMLAMTAAHKSLPLPTYVEVTHLGNGKKIIVKVNDRGPFQGNRLIDLSYAAAKKLGMLGHGTAPVEVRAINLKPKEFPFALAKNNRTTTKSLIYLQVGAFKNKVNAEKLKSQLTSIIASPIKIKEYFAEKKLYRVQIGPIHDNNTVMQINKQLKSIGLHSQPMIG